jgi:CheY-like chemotaxis protein
MKAKERYGWKESRSIEALPGTLFSRTANLAAAVFRNALRLALVRIESGREGGVMATIVVVDDEALITDVLTFLLGEAGYVVHAARNGSDALEVIGRVAPALVITDFMMPVINGLELARAIKADQVFAPIPIILTSAGQGAEAREYPELFAAILDKPYPAKKLLQVISVLLDE